MTISAALRAGYARLRALEEGRLMAEVLLAQALACTRTHVLTHPDQAVPPPAYAQFTAWLARAAGGEPLPYIIEQREFFGLNFYVNPSVLIPRPETEQLVAWALEHLPPGAGWLADVGAGSGCVAVTLAVQRPQMQVLAVDVSYPALQVTRRNALQHGVAGRVRPVQAHLLSAVHLPLQAVIANLPYIPSALARALPVAGHEPLLALDGGPDGLSLIRALLAQAPRALTRPGHLFLEIHPGQGAAVRAQVAPLGPSVTVTVRPDWAGLERFVHLHFA